MLNIFTSPLYSEQGGLEIQLAAIRRAGSYLPCHIRKLLYQSFILPHLEYCSVAWHYCGAMLTSRIERVQNYSMRVILRKPPGTRSQPLRQYLGWNTLEQRRHNAMLSQVHRCLLNIAPKYMCSKFTKNSVRNLNYPSTRGADNLHLKRPLTNSYRTCYNSLPGSTRAVKSLGEFKFVLIIINKFFFSLCRL